MATPLPLTAVLLTTDGKDVKKIKWKECSGTVSAAPLTFTTRVNLHKPALVLRLLNVGSGWLVGQTDVAEAPLPGHLPWPLAGGAVALPACLLSYDAVSGHAKALSLADFQERLKAWTLPSWMPAMEPGPVDAGLDEFVRTLHAESTAEKKHKAPAGAKPPKKRKAGAQGGTGKRAKNKFVEDEAASGAGDDEDDEDEDEADEDLEPAEEPGAAPDDDEDEEEWPDADDDLAALGGDAEEEEEEEEEEDVDAGTLEDDDLGLDSGEDNEAEDEDELDDDSDGGGSVASAVPLRRRGGKRP